MKALTYDELKAAYSKSHLKNLDQAKQIKELTEYAHHHQSCDSVGVYGKLDIECNCGLKQALK
jgi:hypothetical protein